MQKQICDVELISVFQDFCTRFSKKSVLQKFDHTVFQKESLVFAAATFSYKEEQVLGFLGFKKRGGDFREVVLAAPRPRCFPPAATPGPGARFPKSPSLLSANAGPMVLSQNRYGILCAYHPK